MFEGTPKFLFTPQRRHNRHGDSKQSRYFKSTKSKAQIGSVYHSLQSDPPRLGNGLESFNRQLKEEVQRQTIEKKQRQFLKRELVKMQTVDAEEKTMSELRHAKHRLKTIALEKQARISQKASLLRLSTEQDSHRAHEVQWNNLLPSLFAHQMHSLQSQVNGLLNSGVFATNQTRKIADRKRSRKLNHKILPPQETKYDEGLSNFSVDRTIQTPKQSWSKISKPKRTDIFQKKKRSQHLKSIFKRCFLAIFFLKCVKSSVQKTMSARKRLFDHFWPQQFLTIEKQMMKYVSMKLGPFEALLKQNSKCGLQIEGSDSKKLKVEKARTVKQLMRVFFECLASMKKTASMGKIAWHLCHNYSFVEKGVLTPYETHTVSLDDCYGFLRMDAHLEKSQIVSVVMVKLLVFKVVLQTLGRRVSLEGEEALVNVKIVGSIIYRMLLSIQGDHLKRVNLSKYRLGNYSSVRKLNPKLPLECSAPPRFQVERASEDELIGGLTSEQTLRKTTPFEMVSHEYSQLLSEMVEQIHQKSRHYEKQFRKQLSSQRTPKPDFKY